MVWLAGGDVISKLVAQPIKLVLRRLQSTHRERHAKKGSKLLTAVTMATSENAVPVQTLRFCRPRMIVEATVKISDTIFTTDELDRNRFFRDRA
jgi:hypothetical protein